MLTIFGFAWRYQRSETLDLLSLCQLQSKKVFIKNRPYFPNRYSLPKLYRYGGSIKRKKVIQQTLKENKQLIAHKTRLTS